MRKVVVPSHISLASRATPCLVGPRWLTVASTVCSLRLESLEVEELMPGRFQESVLTRMEPPEVPRCGKTHVLCRLPDGACGSVGPNSRKESHRRDGSGRCRPCDGLARCGGRRLGERRRCPTEQRRDRVRDLPSGQRDLRDQRRRQRPAASCPRSGGGRVSVLVG